MPSPIALESIIKSVGRNLTFRQTNVTSENRTTGAVTETANDYTVKGYVSRADESAAGSGTGLENVTDIVQVAARPAAVAVSDTALIGYSPRPGDRIVELNAKIVRQRLVKLGSDNLYWRLEVAGND